MTETAILKIALEGLQADRTESRAMMQYARELQEIWDNALMDAARNNRGTVEKTAPAESRRQVRENFSNEIDSWVKDDMPEGVRFTLGSTGPVMQGLGAIESDIYMEGDKIKKIMQDHPEMTLIGPGRAVHGGGHGPKGQKPALERGGPEPV